MNALTRRTFLAASVAAATIPSAVCRATAPIPQAPGFYRSRLGDFHFLAVHDGFWNRPIDETFVSNTSFAQVQKALADAFLPQDTLPIPFTPLVIDTGSKRILIDTGSGGQIAPTAGSFLEHLAAAGLQPKDIDIVLISNFHPDHINGLKTKDNALVFANAEIRVPEREWSYWMDEGNLTASPPNFLRNYFLNARRIFRDISSRVSRFVPSREVAPGITAIDAPGHTPGHCAFVITSAGKSLLALCDTANNPFLFVRHPEWMPVIDQDGPVAVQTRQRLLAQAAAERLPVMGYHFPFPGFGHIAPRGGGYEFVPSLWQSTL